MGRQPIAANDIPVQLTQLQANLQQQLGAYRQSYEVLAAEAIDRSAGLAWLEDKAQEINRPAAEATLRVDGLDVSSTSSQVGYSLDVIGTHEALYQALLDNQGETIDLQVKENKPLLADVTQAEVLVRQVLGGPLTLAAAEPDVDTPAPPPTYTISAEELAAAGYDRVIASTRRQPAVGDQFRRELLCARRCRDGRPNSLASRTTPSWTTRPRSARSKSSPPARSAARWTWMRRSRPFARPRSARSARRPCR